MKPYIVVEADRVTDLVEAVNRKVDDGYTPLGGISECSTETDERSHYFCSQAMYRKPTKTTKPRSSKVEYSNEFIALWAGYPKVSGANKRLTNGHINARLKEGVTYHELAAGVARYAAYIEATGQYVKLPQTFFGVNRHYENDWTIPSEDTNALPKRDEDLQGWAMKNGHRAALPGEDFRAYRRYLQEQMK